MSAENTVKVRCPSCEAKYRVPVKAAGHRVRCVKCRAVFRVARPATVSPAGGGVVEVRRHGHSADAGRNRPSAEPGRNGPDADAGRNGPDAGRTGPPGAAGRNGHGSPTPTPPTEDDIIRWLNEGAETAEIPARPRMASATPPAKREAAKPDAVNPEEKPAPKLDAARIKPKVDPHTPPLTPRTPDPDEPPTLDAGELRDVLQFRKTG